MIWLGAFVIFMFILAAVMDANTPESFQELYTCDLDGAESALYARRVRTRQWYGKCGDVNFPIDISIVEYRRVSCFPGQRYTASTSDWFTATFSDDNKQCETYTKLPYVEGQRMLAEHRSHAPVLVS